MFLKGQSAIEYLMTYGWMLLVVAVVGGAIFSIAQTQSVDTVSGFSGGDIIVEEFGITSNDELQLVLRNAGSDRTTVNRINITDNQNQYTTWIGELNIGVGSTDTVSLANVSREGGANNLDASINYDQGGLSNLDTGGSISGNIQIISESSIIDERTQFYTDFSEYSDGASLFDDNWSRELDADEDNANLTASELQSEEENYDTAVFSRIGANRQLAGFDEVTSTSGEIEGYAVWQYNDSVDETGEEEMRPSILVHGSGDTGDDITGVRFENHPESDYFDISEYDSGDWSDQFVEQEYAFVEYNYYAFRVWTDGDDAEMTVWEYENEDEALDGVTASTNQITVDSGDFNGIFEWQSNDAEYPFVEIGFGIEGEEAPTQPIE